MFALTKALPLDSSNDGAMITVTGFDVATFQCSLGLFAPFFLACTHWVGNQDGFNCKNLKSTETRGRKRLVNTASCLGLVLAWHRFKGGEFTLQGWFGFTGGHANAWLRFSRPMLPKALRDMEEAKVQLPSDEMTERCELAIHQGHSLLKNACCFANGLKLDFESCVDSL